MEAVSLAFFFSVSSAFKLRVNERDGAANHGFPFFRSDPDTVIVSSTDFELRFDINRCKTPMATAVTMSTSARQTVGKPESIEQRAHDYSHELQQAVQRLHSREEPQLYGRTRPNPWIAGAEWGRQDNDFADILRNHPAQFGEHLGCWT